MAFPVGFFLAALAALLGSTRREESAPESTDDPTAPLARYERGEVTTTVPVSADASTAYPTTEQLRRLLGDEPTPSSSASSLPAVSSTRSLATDDAAGVALRQQLADAMERERALRSELETLRDQPNLPPVTTTTGASGERVTEIPVSTQRVSQYTGLAGALDDALRDGSEVEVARALAGYLRSATPSQWDRALIRRAQTAIHVTSDGLIGAQTRNRIRALTGLNVA